MKHLQDKLTNFITTTCITNKENLRYDGLLLNSLLMARYFLAPFKIAYPYIPIQFANKFEFKIEEEPSNGLK